MKRLFAERKQSVSVNAYLLLSLCLLLELNLTVNESEESIILADTNIVTGMYCCTSLSDNDVAGLYGLTVGLLNTKSLGFAVTTVLCRTNTLFMSKEL